MTRAELERLAALEKRVADLEEALRGRYLSDEQLAKKRMSRNPRRKGGA